MNFLKTEKRPLNIEITPLIDIVFLLVIFFVVTSKVGDSQYLELDLPETESFQYNLVQEGHQITILESGTVLINNNSFNINNYNDIENEILNLDLNTKIIILSAESFTYHSWVVTIMDSLQRNGFNDIQIRTIEK
ncbi:MAG: ExbD/TolR family protein [Gammaproteobacteria bacterium]|jgi:biopolymer transport protein ExbD|tara:strand:+ start:354 stop:758 length:405 start_codon:yes stop_codon:yes gene_type:complete